MTSVPDLRIRRLNRLPIDSNGKYVLYWMTAFRRVGWNFSLQHAADRARELGRPLVILELLKVDYPYASPRLHRFMLEGMIERSLELEGQPTIHYPFVEERTGEGKGLVPALAARACCVVADDFPAFFLPGMISSETEESPVSVELIDSNGLLPLRSTDRVFSAAYHFRRFLQKTLPDHLADIPQPNPLEPPLKRPDGIPDPSILRRWPPNLERFRTKGGPDLGNLSLDTSVPTVGTRGGTGAAKKALDEFIRGGLANYDEDRNHPDDAATSGLSPYLHFGNLSAHEIFSEVSSWTGWTPLRLAEKADGARSGWWGMASGAEAFLDQLVTWRELGFNMAWQNTESTDYDSLPEWARITLRNHQGDPRPYLYDYDEFRNARTHDSLWNAAQSQLKREGTIHNYLRMLWGKKILEWSSSPREALRIMIDLNDRFALDGRDPNSYSGIFWCLGRYDRGWPERPVFGKVRSMSSERTKKKVRLTEYLRRFSPGRSSNPTG